MTKTPTTFYLPETMADWPFPRRFSPHYPEVPTESINWILGVRHVDERVEAVLKKAQVGRNTSGLESETTSSLLCERFILLSGLPQSL